jgi:hypothetical protein
MPVTIGAFFRELVSVVLILILTARAAGYDFFTPGLVLFLILLTFRVPYINSYAFLFEMFCLGDWNDHAAKPRDPAQNLVYIFAVLLAHIGGAIAGAATRVFLDVTYGQEFVSVHPGLSSGLRVDVAELGRFDPFWGAQGRIGRLHAEGITNGTAVVTFPLGAGQDLGVGQLPLIVWYFAEEVGYVFLLCVCFVHIWLDSGVGENKKGTQNPFAGKYWARLFRMCWLLTFVLFALERAFPTAHGSLHVTMFKCQYQLWNPSLRLVDTDNNEPFMRIAGGVVGLLFAWAYNRLLISTERADDDDESKDYWFRLVWGFDPDDGHTKAKRFGKASEVSGFSLFEADVEPASVATNIRSRPDYVKLRIPRVLDHPK